MNLHPLASGRRARGPLLATLTLGLVAALAVSCSSPPPPPPKTVEKKAPEPVASAKPDAKEETPSGGSIIIDDKITQACGGLPSAHFPFDSTTLDFDAKFALEALARCFVSGPLKGRTMRLVGHADPRGETEYNVALGQRRAGSVGDYMVEKGMTRNHVETLSKGSLEAKGTDEQSWARDRKVEIFLAE
jgi:peptidoglycan-associated lipoprotein